MRVTIIAAALAWAGFAAAASAEPRQLTIGATTLWVDEELPVLSCTVLQTSGDVEADENACDEALGAAERAGRRTDSNMMFQPDANGRFIRCAPVAGVERGPDFPARCAAELRRIRNMRAMIAIRTSGWLTSVDLEAAGAPMGVIRLRIGIDDAGRPLYCLIAEPRGTRLVEQTLCSIVMRRARFRPARGIDGRPIPSTFTYPVRWQH